jgi:hypothetical protein
MKSIFSLNSPETLYSPKSFSYVGFGREGYLPTWSGSLQPMLLTQTYIMNSPAQPEISKTCGNFVLSPVSRTLLQGFLYRLLSGMGIGFKRQSC